MGLFNSKNEGTKKQGLQAEQQKLQEKIQELVSKIQRVENALELARTEEMIDSNNTIKGRINKLQKGLEGFQADKVKLQEQAQEVAEQIGEIVAEEKAEEIALASQDFQESFYRNHKRLIFENKLDDLKGQLYAKTGNVQPEALKRVAGLKYNEDLNIQEHSRLIQVRNDAEQKAREQADKEFNELMDKIKGFLEL